MDAWTTQLKTLSKIALSHPHAAYAAFTHGLSNLWLFVCGTASNICRLLEPMEEVIRTSFLPALTGRPPPNNIERDMFALPIRLGRLGIAPPTSLLDEYELSLKVSSPLVLLIQDQSFEYSLDMLSHQKDLVASTRKTWRECWKGKADLLISQLTEEFRCAVLLAEEKGALSRLTSLPINEHGLSLHKGAFRNASRYGMAGNLLIFQLNAPVEKPFQFSKPCPALKEGSQHSATTKSGT